MAGPSAALGDEREDLRPIQRRRLAGGEVLRQQDDRVGQVLQFVAPLPEQFAQHPLFEVEQVRGPFRHLRVAHLLQGLGVLANHPAGGELRRVVLPPDVATAPRRESWRPGRVAHGRRRSPRTALPRASAASCSFSPISTDDPLQGRSRRSSSVSTASTRTYWLGMRNVSTPNTTAGPTATPGETAIPRFSSMIGVMEDGWRSAAERGVAWRQCTAVPAGASVHGAVSREAMSREAMSRSAARPTRRQRRVSREKATR